MEEVAGTGRYAAVLLLRLGTLPFAAGAAVMLAHLCRVLDLSAEQLHAVRLSLVSFSACVLSFIGGMQQTVALHAEHADAAKLVVGGIVIALLSVAAILLAVLSHASHSAALLLCVAYSMQLSLEEGPLRAPPSSRPLMLPGARRLPMRIATIALGIAAVPAREPSSWSTCVTVVLISVSISFFAHRRRQTPPRFQGVAVGTTNPCKLRAVRRTIEAFPSVANLASICACSGISSGVSEQPMSLEETAKGARNRAEAAHASIDGGRHTLGLGIESGLFSLGEKHYDVCVVSAFDGARHHLGLSCAFEIPTSILSHIFQGGLDLSQACKASGITSDPKLGEHGGLISILSKKRVSRLDYTVQAISMALFFAEHPSWFGE
ncbi:hypothetical protein AB1Y20_015230 [Prymnesium parvum]|uniref:inosine/xanthosine triphosphatase n=1 Tax=Prymnesium parvum TaxID=97485 RepID=A0AB34JXX2_PRYPA